MPAAPLETLPEPEPGIEPNVAETDLPVLSNAAENAEYKLLKLKAPPELMARCKPGQFFHLLCPELRLGGSYLRRPMSIYDADPAAGVLSFLYKVTGSGTRALATLHPGERLNVLGPLGIGFDLRPEWRRIAVVGRGVGLATLAPVVDAARRSGRSVLAICSARTPDLLMSIARFQAAGAEVIAVTDSEGTSHPDRLQGILAERARAGQLDATFTCGSDRIIRMLQRLSDEFRLPGQVALEQEMACGLGMCYACVRPIRRDDGTAYLRVCREGPVFPLNEV